MFTTPEQIGIAVALWWLTKPTAAQAKKTAMAKADDLLRRADQAHAHDPWMDVLTHDQHPPLPDDIAAAVCRWFGIESSGNPTAVSSQGERTLAQITKTSALTEGALTQAEWDGAIDPTASPQEQARVAWKVIEWCWDRSKKYVQQGAHRPADAAGSWPARDAIDQIWYAKLYHQAPIDVRDGKLTGVAAEDSRRLEQTWATDAKRLHHLHAANVVAWNSIEAP